MKKRSYLLTAFGVASAGSPTIANAQIMEAEQQAIVEEIQTFDVAVVKVTDPVITELPALADIENDGDFSDEELDAARGGSTIVVGNQTLNAVNSGGVINGDFSAGSINLSDNALTNFNGFGNLVINTGAQNNLQSGMNVTINFAN